MRNLTDLIIFDTDCLSAFLWVDEEYLVEKLYGGKVIIPESVYIELSNPRIPHLKKKIDELIEEKVCRREDIFVETAEYFLYQDLMSLKNGKAIGKGEAAGIVLAKKYNGILASNNFKDIKEYVEKFSLKHLTTGDILVKAFKEKFITEDEGNKIWNDMLKKRRKLGGKSFSEYLEKNVSN